MDKLNKYYAYIPEPLLRLAIRRLLKQRLQDESRLFNDVQHYENMIQSLSNSAIALSTTKANQQHYEVPTEYFQLVLGKHMKYSSCYWEKPNMTLDEAELAMLELYCQRCNLQGDETILELGCGWGSFSLYLATKYPNCSIVALSNSATQKVYIDLQARELGLHNIQVITADINHFDINQKFDVIVSIEMFEHLRNYTALFEKITEWLMPQGKLFIHHFCHRQYFYPYTTDEKNSWMAKYFFTDGLMPSKNLLKHFCGNLQVSQQWTVNGNHYHRTCEAWLTKHKSHRNAIIDIFRKTYGNDSAALMWHYWKIFYLACSELFAYSDGNEWFVVHYLMNK